MRRIANGVRSSWAQSGWCLPCWRRCGWCLRWRRGLADLLARVPFRNGTMGRDIQQSAPESERVVPLVLREDTFPIIGGVTQDFLLQMQHDGSSPTLHDLACMRVRG
ncbi:hypothetical protein ALP39_01424 [Pseudomonas marginalis pv. marginalis]|nr:hypothetical protein ALP39_01424 [Pseudomonas marginalis pv. marginalis]